MHIYTEYSLFHLRRIILSLGKNCSLRIISTTKRFFLTFIFGRQLLFNFAMTSLLLLSLSLTIHFLSLCLYLHFIIFSNTYIWNVCKEWPHSEKSVIRSFSEASTQKHCCLQRKVSSHVCITFEYWSMLFSLSWSHFNSHSIFFSQFASSSVIFRCVWPFVLWILSGICVRTHHISITTSRPED